MIFIEEHYGDIGLLPEFSSEDLSLADILEELD